jgi:hypothetical protein
VELDHARRVNKCEGFGERLAVGGEGRRVDGRRALGGCGRGQEGHQAGGCQE